jgi:hypothetical protein
MAIYRPQRPRWRTAAWAGLLGLGIGLLVGWGLLRPEPDPAEVLGEVRADLASAAATLEVVEIEYTESVEDGRVVAPPEYEGARDALASSRARYEEARPGVAAISTQTASAIDDAYDRLAAVVDARAPAEEISTSVRELRDMLGEALGG